MINSLSVGVLYPLWFYLTRHQNFPSANLTCFSPENQFFTSELDILTCDWVFSMRISPSPALLSFQQLPVGGDLHIQRHLDVEQVLVLPEVARHLVLHVGDFRLQPGDGVLEAAGLQSVTVLHVPHLPHQGLILDSERRVCCESDRTARASNLYVCETYGAFERVDLAGVGLDLVSELHGLLPGLLQGLVVLTHRLVQVRHLEGQRSKVRNYR